jgi:hypothetical protein
VSSGSLKVGPKSVGADPGPTAAWLLSVGMEAVELLRGDPATARISDRAATRTLLDAIRDVSDRPHFGEFKAIEAHAARRGDLPRGVIRALAIALLDKMRWENATITSIVQHRRNAGAAEPTLEP